MDPKMKAKLEALRLLQEQGGEGASAKMPGRGEGLMMPPVDLTGVEGQEYPAVETKPVEYPAVDVRAPKKVVEVPPVVVVPAEEKGEVAPAADDSAGWKELLSGLSAKGNAGLDAIGFPKLDFLKGGKPKLSDAAPPESITVKEKAVTVEPGPDDETGPESKRAFNRRRFLRGHDDET